MDSKGGLLYEELTADIISCAYEVPKYIGYGMMERDYQLALAEEFRQREIKFVRELRTSLQYKHKSLAPRILDFVIDDKVVLEIKVAKFITDGHKAQLLSYLKANNYRLGLVICFGDQQVVIKRVIR